MNSPLLLAIDTTSPFGSLALLRGRELVQEMPLYSEEGFSQTLFGFLEGFLRRLRVPLEEVEAFAGLAGPGSFTGVRVCLTAVKGLAQACGKPAFGVSNLQALALFGHTALRATFLDARRGEVYAAVWDEALHAVAEECVTTFARWVESLPVDAELIATDFLPFRPVLAAGRLKDAPQTSAPRALAAAAGKIAMERYLAGERPGAASLDANYVRRADAELKWRDK